MNWRWLVVALMVAAVVDAMLGFAAYSTSTWNWEHTEVLTGWAAAREVCFVYFPIFAGALAGGAGLIAVAALWATNSQR